MVTPSLWSTDAHAYHNTAHSPSKIITLKQRVLQLFTSTEQLRENQDVWIKYTAFPETRDPEKQATHCLFASLSGSHMHIQ